MIFLKIFFPSKQFKAMLASSCLKAFGFIDRYPVFKNFILRQIRKYPSLYVFLLKILNKPNAAYGGKTEESLRSTPKNLLTPLARHIYKHLKERN